MDSVISLLSDEARTELAKLWREYAITFADKDGGKSVFQCREDYQQGLLKEVNASFNRPVFHQSAQYRTLGMHQGAVCP